MILGEKVKLFICASLFGSLDQLNSVWKSVIIKLELSVSKGSFVLESQMGITVILVNSIKMFIDPSENCANKMEIIANISYNMKIEFMALE